MADFIADLATGINGNQEANNYGNEHEEVLCSEFAGKMYGSDLRDWLFGTNGKDNKPNDLDYWIGYDIVKVHWMKRRIKNRRSTLLQYNKTQGINSKENSLNPIIKKFEKIDKSTFPA